jgi:hypothetical protein
MWVPYIERVANGKQRKTRCLKRTTFKEDPYKEKRHRKNK